MNFVLLLNVFMNRPKISGAEIPAFSCGQFVFIVVFKA
jgi:hypothetical protein